MQMESPLTYTASDLALRVVVGCFCWVSKGSGNGSPFFSSEVTFNEDSDPSWQPFKIVG